MVLQIKLADLVQEGAILALPRQSIHLLSVHDTFVGHIQTHHANVWGLPQNIICCFWVPNDICLCTGANIAVAEECSTQHNQLLLQYSSNNWTGQSDAFISHVVVYASDSNCDTDATLRHSSHLQCVQPQLLPLLLSWSSSLYAPVQSALQLLMHSSSFGNRAYALSNWTDC